MCEEHLRTIYRCSVAGSNWRNAGAGMRKRKNNTMVKIGIFFGGGYFGIILFVLLFCSMGTSDGVDGLPIMANEEQAYSYQYTGAEVGVPWDMALLADIFLADENGRKELEDLNPILTSLQFCIVTEKRYERRMVETEELTPEGTVKYEVQWEETCTQTYYGLDQILEYMDVEDTWIRDKDMTDVLSKLKKVCEEKAEDGVEYAAAISVNSDSETVLKDYIGLTEESCRNIIALHNVQYMAQLYGYVYDFEEAYLPELVVGEVTREELAQVAVSLIGHPYLLGGKSPEQGSPKGPLDCSGFVDWVYIQCFGTGVSGGGVPEGVAVSGTAMQWYASMPIEESELKVGDLAFLYDPAKLAAGKVNHVGIYIGSIDGTEYFIHCAGRSYGTEASPSGRVGISVKKGSYNSYNCVTGGSFEPSMKPCNFKFFRRPAFSFLDD